MANIEIDEAVGNRALMALFGALAGLAMWFLIDELPDILENMRVILGLSAFVAGFFAVLLAAFGPLTLRPAILVAGILALMGAGLLLWASLRFDEVSIFLETGHPLAAYVVIMSIPVPFAVAGLRDGEGWRCYPALFEHAWQIFVRYLVAWAFVGLFWLVVLLSDLVLNIVGLTVVGDLLEFDPVPFLLTGLMLGLGLAVVHELRAYVSPYLALRLLRLMLPLVLAVSVVFLLAAPLKGLSNLFGGLSAAGTLMTLALAAATLITAALDASEETAATSPILVWSSRIMALVLPLLGALAAWAVWLRVAQYGLTPTRLVAMTSVLVVLAYGVIYALAVLRGAGWQARIRQANITMALVLIGLAVLWLSPVLNVERMSVKSQIARFEDGKIDASDLDLWEIGREWGRAGVAALEALQATDHPDHARLEARLALLAGAETRWQWRDSESGDEGDAGHGEFLEKVAILPHGAALPEGAFSGAYPVDDWLAGCARKTPANNPGCAALVADFSKDIPGDEVVVFYLDGSIRLRAYVWTSGDRYIEILGESVTNLGPEGLDSLYSGAFELKPLPEKNLSIGEYLITVGE